MSSIGGVPPIVARAIEASRAINLATLPESGLRPERYDELQRAARRNHDRPDDRPPPTSIPGDGVRCSR
jgi:hypothetical protein